MTDPTWEKVASNEDRIVRRLPVPGGWLYLIEEKGDYGMGIMFQNAVFVPKPETGRK